MKTYQLFIDGAWQAGALGTQEVINPSTEQVAARIPVAGEADLDKALAAAIRARNEWANTDVLMRVEILRKAEQILADKIPLVAQQMVAEQAKTLAEASGELQRARDTFRWSAMHAQDLCKPMQVDERRTLMFRPVGIVAAFTPWNYPAVLTARKIAPALAAGCAVILKAAEEAPASAVALVEALQEAGLPSGVIALVFGDPPKISAQLLASPEVRMITFTGSTRVGKELAALAAKNLQTCVLELGGHSPVLVFDDTDIPSAVRAICDYKFEYAGQSCNAPSRVFVQRSCFDEFLRELLKVAGGIRMGPTDNPAVQMGPMIGAQGPARMGRLTEDAVAKGARVVLGGREPEGQGFFWPPTILTDVPDDAALMSEEPFGPVLPVAPFDTIDEAIEKANRTSYGLASYVFTRSEQRERELLDRLASGSVSVNFLKGIAPDVPNPGLRDSGYGHEGGKEGFRAFQNIKLVNRTGK